MYLFAPSPFIDFLCIQTKKVIFHTMTYGLENYSKTKVRRRKACKPNHLSIFIYLSQHNNVWVAYSA